MIIVVPGHGDPLSVSASAGARAGRVGRKDERGGEGRERKGGREATRGRESTVRERRG